MAIINAHIVHVADPHTSTAGSLLILIEQYGTTLWLKPEQVKNYKDLTLYNTQLIQDIEVSDYVYDLTQYTIKNKRQQLLQYKKGGRR